MTIDPTAALSASAPSDPSLGLPPVSDAAIPATVRNGSAKQKQDYAAALGFEQMLLSQLTQAMTATANPSSSSDSSDGSDTSDGSDSGNSSDPAMSMYQQMLPDVLAQSMTSAGGVGLAGELYKALEGGVGSAAAASPTPAAQAVSAPSPEAPEQTTGATAPSNGGVSA